MAAAPLTSMLSRYTFESAYRRRQDLPVVLLLKTGMPACCTRLRAVIVEQLHNKYAELHMRSSGCPMSKTTFCSLFRLPRFVHTPHTTPSDTTHARHIEIQQDLRRKDEAVCYGNSAVATRCYSCCTAVPQGLVCALLQQL
jgi:hypothetical protein